MPADPDRPRRWTLALWWPYALIALLYGVTSPYHAGLNNPNEMVRVYMSKAWVDHGSFVIQPVIRQWGPVDDKAQRDNRLYSSKAPLQSLVGIPAYAVAPLLLEAIGSPVNKRTITWVMRLFGAAGLGIAFAWVLLAWCQHRSVELGAGRALGTTVGLGLALGTMIYPYSITFTGHGLAALAAGGCLLAVVALSRAVPGSRAWWSAGLAAGFLGGATPFSEYPAALVAAPALFAAFAVTKGWRRRAQLFGGLLAGGAAPFGLGLWAHWKLWGHPLRTGYGFLENRAYVEVHGEGFFGVSFPRGEAFVGSLFSPGTGLFFYSPLLVMGLVAAIIGCRRAPHEDDPTPLRRAIAIATLVAFAASIYFISSHRGWRGGWTVGPRYIVAVAPMLGLWTLESLRWPRWRPLVAGLAALSIVTTGFAAALYPHLSDVYTNPLTTFLWQSYSAGKMTYGLGHSLGLTGGLANLVHILPLGAAVVYCVGAGLGVRAAPRIVCLNGGLKVSRIVGATAPLVVGIAMIAAIPERDADAAHRENQRLWGFWEPTGPSEGSRSRRRPERPGRVYRARTAFRDIRVETQSKTETRPCGPFRSGYCFYGPQPWQKFGPERLTMAGMPEDLLFLHPIAGKVVRATIPVHGQTHTLVLRYGMADASVAVVDNPHLIALTLRQGTQALVEHPVPRTTGLKEVEVTLTSTLPVTLELRVKRDGARVFGFDIDQYR